MLALLKNKSTPLVTVIVGSILTLSGCAHSPNANVNSATAPLTSSTTINPKQTPQTAEETTAAKEKKENRKETRKNTSNAGQTPFTLSDITLRQNNIARNQVLLAEIKKQNYTPYHHGFYFKVLKQGKRLPASSMVNKTVTLTLNETLTDGTVTVDYNKTQPLVIPYYQLPSPLNLFITETGEHGKLKIYALPEVAYGSAGIPGKIPPESISITTIEVLSIQ